jgi:hypothetical protein
VSAETKAQIMSANGPERPIGDLTS